VVLQSDKTGELLIFPEFVSEEIFFKRFYVQAKLDNIINSVSKDFNVNFSETVL
jgi:hypothetical protein